MYAKSRSQHVDLHLKSLAGATADKAPSAHSRTRQEMAEMDSREWQWRKAPQKPHAS